MPSSSSPFESIPACSCACGASPAAEGNLIKRSSTNCSKRPPRSARPKFPPAVPGLTGACPFVQSYNSTPSPRLFLSFSCTSPAFRSCYLQDGKMRHENKLAIRQGLAFRTAGGSRRAFSAARRQQSSRWPRVLIATPTETADPIRTGVPSDQREPRDLSDYPASPKNLIATQVETGIPVIDTKQRVEDSSNGSTWRPAASVIRVQDSSSQDCHRQCRAEVV